MTSEKVGFRSCLAIANMLGNKQGISKVERRSINSWGNIWVELEGFEQSWTFVMRIFSENCGIAIGRFLKNWDLLSSVFSTIAERYVRVRTKISLKKAESKKLRMVGRLAGSF